MHARYFSAELGRFHSVDPVGADPTWPQSWNRYSYVLGNPVKYTDPSGLYWSPALVPFDQIPIASFDDAISVTGTNVSLFFSVMGLLSGPSSISGGFPAAQAGAAPGMPAPEEGDQAWPCGSNVFFDTLSGAIEDIGPISISGSLPLFPVVGLLGGGFSASLTARPDGSADLYVGGGGILGTSVRASSPGLAGSFFGWSTGGRPSGFGLRGAGAVGFGNIIGLPLGLRGSGFLSSGHRSGSIGAGIVGGASGSLTFGYVFNVADPFPTDCP